MLQECQNADLLKPMGSQCSVVPIDILEPMGSQPSGLFPYRHSGNGIIEQHHRTIMRMGTRMGGANQDMVYWYNNTPNSDRIVLADTIYR